MRDQSSSFVLRTPFSPDARSLLEACRDARHALCLCRSARNFVGLLERASSGSLRRRPRLVVGLLRHSTSPGAPTGCSRRRQRLAIARSSLSSPWPRIGGETAGRTSPSGSRGDKGRSPSHLAFDAFDLDTVDLCHISTEFSTRQRDTARRVGDLEGCDDESEEDVFGWRAA